MHVSCLTWGSRYTRDFNLNSFAWLKCEVMSDSFLVVDAVLVGIMCRNASLSCMPKGGSPKFLFKYTVKCALHVTLLTCSFPSVFHISLNFVHIRIILSLLKTHLNIFLHVAFSLSLPISKVLLIC